MMYIVITNPTPTAPPAMNNISLASEQRMLQATPNYTLATNATIVFAVGQGFMSAVRVLSVLSVLGMAVLSVFAF